MLRRRYGLTALVVATALFVNACGGSVVNGRGAGPGRVQVASAEAPLSDASTSAAGDKGVPTWVWWTVGAIVAAAIIAGIAVGVTAHGASHGAENTQPPTVNTGLLGG